MSDLAPTPPAIVAAERSLAVIVEDIRLELRKTGASIVRIGQLLLEVRSNWGTDRLRVVITDTGISRSSAYRCMGAADRFAGETVDRFEASALYLLSEGDTPDEARHEALELAAKGETITHARAAEIKQRHAPTLEDDPRQLVIPGAEPPPSSSASQPILEPAPRSARTVTPEPDALEEPAALSRDQRMTRSYLAKRLGDDAMADMVAGKLEAADALQERVAELEAEVASAKGPNAHTSAKSTEYGTPDDVLDDARYVLGAIDLDPASCAKANARVKARAWWGKEDDGLTKDWCGNVFLNAPGDGDMGPFTDKLFRELLAGRTTAAFVVIFNSHTGRAWYESYWGHLVALPRRPIAYLRDHEAKAPAPPHASAFALVGGDVEQQRRFVERMRARRAKIVPPDAWMGELPPPADDPDPVARLKHHLEAALGAVEDAESAGADTGDLESYIVSARGLVLELEDGASER